MIARTLLGRAALLVGTALVLGPVALAAPPATVEAPRSTWNAVAASGPVESQLAAVDVPVWNPVRRGDHLQPLTTVRTGPKGRATLTRRADILIVDARSEVELPATDPEAEASVVQTRGSVVYEIDGRQHRDFKVVTPYLVAGVKGTVFRVTVNDRYASVTVDEGSVEVASRRDGQTRMVEEGEMLMVDIERDETVAMVDADHRDNANREARRVARHEARRLDRAVDMMQRDLRDHDAANAADETAMFEDEADAADLVGRLDDDNATPTANVAGDDDDALAEELADEDARNGDVDEIDNMDPDPNADPAGRDPDSSDPGSQDPVDPGSPGPNSGSKEIVRAGDPAAGN